MNEKNHLFSNHALKMLLIPLVAEQFLTSLMGTADSMMVSNVGSAAISAVSLVAEPSSAPSISGRKI